MSNYIIDIGLAQFDEISQISLLNEKWLENDFLNIDTKNGFLFGDSFRESDLKRIVDNNELIVAKKDGQIIGYYLLDNHSDSHVLKDHERLIEKYIKDDTTYENSSISRRMQCVVDADFQMLGISTAMFQKLLSELGNKYDFLFATVSKHNPKYKAHLKLGWEKYGETDDLYLLLYNCRKIMPNNIIFRYS